MKRLLALEVGDGISRTDSTNWLVYTSQFWFRLIRSKFVLLKNFTLKSLTPFTLKSSHVLSS